MSKSLADQLENVVYGCATPNHSKRADKFNDAIDTGWKIYSETSWQDMRDLARNFGDFVQEHFPDKTRTYHIDRDTIQAYLDSKAATCNDKTIGKNYSRIKKFESCCKHVFFRDADKFNWGIADVTVPKSTKDAEFIKDKPVPLEVSQYAIGALRDRRTEAGNAVTLSAYAGMRAKETTCLKVENVHFSGGEFGIGYIEIIKGPEGGAKGGRPRIIPILNIEAQSALQKIVAGKKFDDYVAAKVDGSKMTPDNVQRTLREVMDAKYGSTYKGNRCHGMRKTWAQNYYDTVRGSGYTKKQAVSKTNEVLGHGSDRGEQMVKMYVKNIW